MKYLKLIEEVIVPEDVTLKAKSRVVTAIGKFGMLKRSFKDAKVIMKLVDITPGKKGTKGKKLVIETWLAGGKRAAQIRTVAAVIKNMIHGVQRQFRFVMRAVYAHFPINMNVEPAGKMVVIGNYLGQKKRLKFAAIGDCVIRKLVETRDAIEVVGIDLGQVSQTCANICDGFSVGNRDRRKFLDGIYVSAKGYGDSVF